jgi:hypothetical protein
MRPDLGLFGQLKGVCWLFNIDEDKFHPEDSMLWLQFSLRGISDRLWSRPRETDRRDGFVVEDSASDLRVIRHGQSLPRQRCSGKNFERQKARRFI